MRYLKDYIPGSLDYARDDRDAEGKTMSRLGAVVEAVEKHGRFVLEQVKRARNDEKFAQAVTERWNKVKAEIPFAKAPTGLPLQTGFPLLPCSSVRSRPARIFHHSAPALLVRARNARVFPLLQILP